MSGDELAAAIGTMGGVNAITAAIQTLRRNVTTRLRKIGIQCGPEDVILHDEQGYYLSDAVSVGDASGMDATRDPAAKLLTRIIHEGSRIG